MEKYTVQKGDSLWKIAKKRNISLEALIAANPQIMDINAVIPGIQINIPGNPLPPTVKSAESYIRLTEEEAPPASCGVCETEKQERPFIYTCVKHDSLDKIVERFSVAKSLLLYCNPQLKERGGVEFGDKILIPGLDPALSAQQAAFCYSGEDGSGGVPEEEESPCSGCCLCPYCGHRLRICRCGE